MYNENVHKNDGKRTQLTDIIINKNIALNVEVWNGLYCSAALE